MATNDTCVHMGTINPYVFCTEAYEGSGGFKDGRYLAPFDREDNYQDRKKQAVYKNYVKGVVDSLITPVFSTPAVRTTDSSQFEGFISNCTANGVTLQQFIKDVVLNSRLHGISFVVVDNFSTLPATVKESLDNRLYPYVYMRKAYEYVKHTQDTIGRLTSITFTNGTIKVGTEDKPTNITFTRTNTIVTDKDNDKKVYSDNKHDLGIVPVVPVKVNQTSSLQPMPPTYDLCKCNYTIYNQTSEQRNIERLQSFSLLIIPGNESNSSVSVGADSVLWIDPSSSQSPSYINPNPAVLDSLMKSEQKNIDQLLSMADTLGATAVVKNSAESGVSKSYTFLGQSFALQDTATMATWAELSISKLFELYTGEVTNYAVKYKSRYAPGFVETQQRLDMLLKLLSVPNLPPETISSIMSEIDNLYKEAFGIEDSVN